MLVGRGYDIDIQVILMYIAYIYGFISLSLHEFHSSSVQ